MRTTLNTIYRSIEYNLNKITSDLSVINSQMSSGRQMSRLSDNPVNLVSALGYRTNLAELSQLTKNINYGNTIIAASESGLVQIKDLVMGQNGGIELATSSIDGRLTPGNRLALAEGAHNLLMQSITLGNTQQAGKFIFGGQRTTGYTEAEPAPFVLDKGDGHWINGASMSPLSDGQLTGLINNTADLTVGDLAINGAIVGDLGASPIVLTAGLTNGLNMSGAANMQTAINTNTDWAAATPAATPVTANLTTLYAGIPATADTADLIDTVLNFAVNGEAVTVTIPDGSTATVAATLTAAAISAASATTGVSAAVGTGANGGAADSVVLRNTEAGNDSAIVVTNFTTVSGDASPGFGNFSQAADATHNTGEISLESSEAYTITSPNHTDDTILALIGLDGGGVGFLDEGGDGTITQGYLLGSSDLRLNGLEVPAATDDGISTHYTNASAAAKAAAINSVADDTGVRAEIIPVQHFGSAVVSGGTELSRLTGLVSNTVIISGDLLINDTALGTIAGGAITRGLNMEKALNARTEINLLSSTTNVSACLTTLTGGTVSATTGALPTPMVFTINDETISVTTGGVSARQTAKDIIAAINAVSSDTGVEATLGDDENGGIADSIILSNVVKGNEDAIVVAGLSAAESTLSGLGNQSQAADLTHNTGEISLESELPFTVTTPTTIPNGDTVLNELGLSSENANGTGAGAPLNGTLPTGALAGIGAGELAVNGVPITGAITGAPSNGINMAMAAAAVTEIENADPAVRVQLTTLNSDAAAVAATADSDVTFYLNGQQVNVVTSNGDSAAQVAQAAVTAINLTSGQTGVEAVVGDGSNGGPLNAVVFRNIEPGDESPITVSALSVTSGNNDLGFSDFNVAADATHNSGVITITSDSTFDLSSPTTLDDTFLDQLGLGGGNIGYSDRAGDGLVYGSAGTGAGEISFGATPEYLDENDLVINGVNIFETPTAILGKDATNSLLTAINAKTEQTGIRATVDLSGKLLLSAVDGRNLHIHTSAQGESVTHLNDGSQDQVYFGSLQLNSERRFTMYSPVGSAPTNYEAGFATLGMSGGEAITGEPDDVAGDGEINVFSIHDQEGYVRYNGDRDNNLEVKIGRANTLEISLNGKEAIADATTFTTMRKFEDALRGENFTTVTGIHQATDTTALLNSRDTGLEPASLELDEDLFKNGSFTVKVVDHEYNPSRLSGMSIAVRPEYDSLDTIAQRINGIPQVTAEWTADGELKISSSDPERYTISLENDSSNFLEATGVDSEQMQIQALEQSLTDFHNLQDNLSERISDFGARANRTQVQLEIYSQLDLASTTNLSELQDTDLTKAILNLKAKEVAYQAALSAAAKTMQLSLVDYL